MPLSIDRKRGKPGLWITGTVAGVRIRRRAQSNDPKLAREEAAVIEAGLLRAQWHGKRPGLHTFGQAVLAYLAHEPRAEAEKARLNRLLRGVGDVPLHTLDQESVDRLRAVMLRPDAAPATAAREIITPLRAILAFAARRKWCDAPSLDAPRATPGRTAFLLPAQFEALRDAAAPHLRPLLAFLIGTGARLGEALALEWDAVDLAGGRVRFHADQTKAGKAYTKALPPAVVVALAGLPHRDGPVFRTAQGQPYGARDGAGGHIRSAWATAMRRAGLAGFTPHDLRHSWASWHYAVHRDLLALKAAGGWSSVVLVERYAHLIPAGQEEAIRRVWGIGPMAERARA